MMSLESLKGE